MSNHSATSFRVRAFVLGAQKCATSWLYYCLRDHPSVALPTSKLEEGYLGSAMFRDRGTDWYFSRFQRSRHDAVLGEVAVDYMLDSTVPTILGRYADDPRFVVLLRHPVDRLVSAYYWSVRRRQLPNQPIDAGIARLLDEDPGFPRRFSDPYFDELVRRAFYGEQLDAFLHEFEPARFLVVAYSEVLTQPEAVIRRIYEHIGVDAGFIPPSLSVTPKKNSYNRFAMALERSSKGVNLARIADRANRALSWIRPRRSDLSSAARWRLAELFDPHVAHTEQTLACLPPRNRPPWELVRSWRG